MNTKYIAAIEIGSSKIKGIVAAVDSTMAINVLALENTDAVDIVRYGRVQNETETASRINETIRRLENNPRLSRGSIKSIYVAEGGRSVCSFRADATIRQGSEMEITDQTLNRLKIEAQRNLATGRDVLAISPRRYFADNAEVKKINGAFGNVVKGEFTIITASPENRRKLDRLKIESHGVEIPRKYIPRPIALADMVLSDSDRQLGCLLVDFGAETTTVAIFYDNALQMLTTLPMGSININHDLCTGLGITKENAENIKISKGEAVADRVALERFDGELREINNYITARSGEIIANIINQVEVAGYKPHDLKAGIILAGGGSRLKGFIEMLEKQSNMKVRRATLDSSVRNDSIFSSDNIDILSLVKYIAANFESDCLDFPQQAVAEETVKQPEIVSKKEVEDTQSETEETYYPKKKKSFWEKLGFNNGNDNMDADLGDDPELEDNYDDDELPPPDDNPNETRKRLLSSINRRLKGYKDYFAPPVEDDGLDEEDVKEEK